MSARHSLLVLALATCLVACGGAAEPRSETPEPLPGRSSDETPAPAARQDPPPARTLAEGAEEHALAVSVYGASEPGVCGLEPPDGGGRELFFGCTPESGPVVQAVAARSLGEGVTARAALAALLAGPTEAEREAGYLSNFGPNTKGIGFELQEAEDGLWLVDFDAALGEVDFLFVTPMDAAQIVATLGQFDGVERVLIHVGGEPLCKLQDAC